MSGWIIRFIVLSAILTLIIWGIRKIWRDWTGTFREVDQTRRKRDLAERSRPDVIDLSRDKDGTYRPREKDGA